MPFKSGGREAETTRLVPWAVWLLREGVRMCPTLQVFLNSLFPELRPQRAGQVGAKRLPPTICIPVTEASLHLLWSVTGWGGPSLVSRPRLLLPPPTHLLRNRCRVSHPLNLTCICSRLPPPLPARWTKLPTTSGAWTIWAVCAWSPGSCHPTAPTDCARCSHQRAPVVM